MEMAGQAQEKTSKGGDVIRPRRRRSCRALLALLLATALPPAAPAQALDAQIRAEVARYVRTVNAGDPAALAALYLDSPAVGSLGNGNVATGRRDVAALLDDVYRTVDSIRMSVDSVTVLPLGPDAALSDTGGAVFGAAPRWEAGAMTLVFRRANGRWWVAHDHTSTLPGDQPAALPAPADSVAGPRGPVRQTTACVVTRVTDGDTIECRGIGRVRRTSPAVPLSAMRRGGTFGHPPVTTRVLCLTSPLSQFGRGGQGVRLGGGQAARLGLGRHPHLSAERAIRVRPRSGAAGGPRGRCGALGDRRVPLPAEGPAGGALRVAGSRSPRPFRSRSPTSFLEVVRGQSA